MDLAFYQYSRQPYGDSVPREGKSVEDELMIGDYGEPDTGVGDGGEFAVVVHRFGVNNYISLRLVVFHDGFGSFRRACLGGLLETLERDYVDATRLAEELIRMGYRDLSDRPLGV